MTEKALYTPIIKFLLMVDKIHNYFPFQLIRNRYKNNDKFKDACLVEKLIFLDILIASISLVAINLLNKTDTLGLIFLLIILIWAIVRVLDIVVYLIYALFIEGRKIYIAQRFLFLLILNVFEILIWYAVFYRIWHCMFKNGELIGSIHGSLYFSVVTMTTLGYGDVTPTHWLSMFLICTQTLIGLFILILLISRFLGSLGKMESKISFEEILKKKKKERE